ncbi:MAG: VWA domain-containing protein [Gemmatimonadota bacterium]
MRFADPFVLLLLPVAALLFLWRRRGSRTVALPFTIDNLIRVIPTSARERFRNLPRWLTAIGFALLIVALARPQFPTGREEVKLRSRNILVALDISSSMKAKDFQPGNRLAVARSILQEFVQKRDGDLVGLVIFSGRAFLQAPLTSDMHLLESMLGRADIGQLPDGTAIGVAIAMGLNQLKNLPAKASCIVLITDGANNTGSPTLAEATEMARALGVRVHAIGLTSADTTSYALNGVWSVRRDRAARLSRGDELTLRRVAERTGGRYARATSPQKFAEIMAGIDPLERQDVTVKETRTYRELFPFVLGAGLILLLLERGLSATWLRTAL